MFNKKSILIASLSFACFYLHDIRSITSEIEDTGIRKIGIFSGGLLASQPKNLKIEAPFTKSTLTLPTQLGRVFGGVHNIKD